MKGKKRRNIIIWSVAALIVVIAGYFSFIHPQQQAKRTVTAGITAGSKQDGGIWNSVSETAKDKYNATLKFRRFTGYNQPNKVLENGDVDLNVFQHKLFLQTWDKVHKIDLVSLGDTFITPIRLHSEQYKNVKKTLNGGTIAVPNDASGGSWALFVLKNVGLIDLERGTKLATVSSISKNSRDLKIKELAADQTARSLDNIDAAVVNTNHAQAAGLNYKSATLVEPVNKNSKQWVNIVAVKDSEKNNKIYKDVVCAYQTEKTKREVKKLYGTAKVSAQDLNFNK